MSSNYVIILISYILGIYFSNIYDISFVLFSAISLLSIAVIQRICKKDYLTFIILAIIMTLGSVRYYQASENEIVSRFPDKYVTVNGIIYSNASLSDGDYKYRYTMKLESISYLGETFETDDKILLNTKESLPFGTKISAKGFLSEIEGINNEYEFDFSQYYMGQGVFARLTAQEMTTNGIAFSPTPTFISGRIRQWASNLIDSHFSEKSAPIIKAIITGDKSGFSDEYYTLLVKSGIYRLLFSPYLHILPILLVVGFLPFGKRHRDFTTVLILLVYAVFCSSSPTALKASLLCGLFIFKNQVWGYGNKLDLLAKIVLILALINPLICLNTGFIMSVASSVIMYYAYSPIYLWLCKHFKKLKGKNKFFISKTLTLWIMFIFGTLPLGAYLFKGISPYATVTMTLLTPIIVLMLLASPILLLSLQIFGSAPVLGDIMSMLSQFLYDLTYWVTKLPFYYLALKTPKITEIIIYYLFGWCFLRWISEKFHTRKTAVILTIAASLTISGLFLSSSENLQLYFVNVGQGDGAVLHTSKGETVLIDGGGSPDYETNYNIGEKVFVPYLTSHGFSDIDVAIISHPHKDHVEGIIAAAETLKIHTIVMPDIEPSNQYRLMIEKIAKDKNICIEYLGAGDKISFESDLEIEMLAPFPDQTESDDTNELSLVCHVSYGDFSALFTGDSTDQNNINYPSNIDILKVAHHGSKTSTSEAFLEHTNPKYAVISVGKDNSYNHPSDIVITRLLKNHTNILRTDRHGDIRFKIKKDGSIRYKTLKGE